ncbi:hypothetical protein [Bradyrhizobium sp. CCGUVB4N]|nr:hypothetical protein [Bradyrhizobium sp. CCGUVB4N]
MLSGVDAGKICKVHPQLDRNDRARNRIDITQCVKQRIATPDSAI